MNNTTGEGSRRAFGCSSAASSNNRCSSFKSLPYATPTGTRMRTFGSPWLQFVTLFEIKSALGTIMVMLSLVTTVVLLSWIFVTRPATPATSIRSPIEMGRSARMMMPLTKLLIIFCRPNPTPTPSDAAIIASELRSNPTA